MDVYLDDYISLLQTSSSFVYETQGLVSSGRISQKCAEPLNTPNHRYTLSGQGSVEKLSLTVSAPQVEISSEVDTALWSALKDSTKLISEGRLLV